MQPLMPCTRPDFDGALFNFRIFLKLGAPTCLGSGASCPPLPPPLSAALIPIVPIEPTEPIEPILPIVPIVPIEPIVPEKPIEPI